MNSTDIIFDDSVSSPYIPNHNMPGPHNDVCKKCGLWKGCNSPWMPREGSHADILIVGEAPGSLEDKQGRPFVGSSGDLLRSTLEDYNGVKFAFTNSVRCHPVDNKTPTISQIKHCNNFLLQDIEETQAKTVLLVGNTALRSMIGQNGIMGWRGKKIKKDGKTYFPTYHPAMFLHSQAREDQMLDWLNDIDKAVKFSQGEEEPPAPDVFSIRVVTTLAEAEEMFSKLAKYKRCGFDLEFKYLGAYRPDNAILIASFAIMNKEATKGIAWALPLMHPESPFTDDETLILVDKLEEFAESETGKIGHNIKIDHLQLIANYGIELLNVIGDTMLLSQLLDSRPGFHDLKQLAGKHLGMYDYDSELEMYVATHPEADYARGGDYSTIPLNILAPYAAKDAAATLALEPVLTKQLDDALSALYYELVVQASSVFTRIESNGNAVDTDVINQYAEIYINKNNELLQEMRALPYVRSIEEYLNVNLAERYAAGKLSDEDYKLRYKSFNPNSPVQVRKVVYDHLQMPIIAVTESGYPSVKAAIVKWLDHPWISKYTEWKLYSSAMSKYLRPVWNWIDVDGRVRSQYKIIGTETGRTASAKPNMQNIPAPEKNPDTLLESHPIKDIFRSTYDGHGELADGKYVSWDGGCLMSVDYSAMEMRIMATVSQSKAMIKMFREGKDPHTYVSSKLYKVPEAEVQKPQRYRAKWVNWTMLFGGGWNTLVGLYRIPEEEAKELQAGWYSIFPEVPEYNTEMIEFTREHGYSVSNFGRRRYLPNITSEDRKFAAKAEREATNHPIQSAASDVLMMALVIIDSIMLFHGFKTKIINTVHDSIVFDIYPGELDSVYGICLDVMVNIKHYAADHYPNIATDWIQVPFVADAEIGINYGSLKPYEGRV